MYPYFDAHCDTLSRCLQEGWDLWENPGHLDLRRLSACAPAGQVFSLFLDSARVPPPERFARISAQAELFRRARAAPVNVSIVSCPLSRDKAAPDGEERRFLDILPFLFLHKYFMLTKPIGFSTGLVHIRCGKLGGQCGKACGARASFPPCPIQKLEGHDARPVKTGLFHRKPVSSIICLQLLDI